MTLYHVTKKEKIPGILEKGLIPQIGENCLTAETKNFPDSVFLCEEKDIPLWAILTRGTACMALSPDTVKALSKDGNLTKREYTGYSECICTAPVPCSALSECPMPGKADMQAAMRQLCKSYLYVISSLCIRLIVIEHRLSQGAYDGENSREEYAADVDAAKENVSAYLDILERLDFRSVTAAEYSKTLTRMSLDECGYTFSDYYADTGSRYWEHLRHLACPELEETAKKLHSFISETFPKKALYVRKIGGWCM